MVGWEARSEEMLSGQDELQGRWRGMGRASRARAGGALVRRGTRARWRGLCDRRAVVACAKSGEARLRGGGRWWRRKAAAFEHGAWAAGGEARVTASGQAGDACGWGAAWEGPGWSERGRGCAAATPRAQTQVVTGAALLGLEHRVESS